MRYFSIICLSLAAILGLASHSAKAATLNAGDLIKASGQAVYYYSQNGKRLVFPTEKTYKTWYADFSSVKTISDSELAAISLGGNVTYKPGVKLVKITTDPKVYAVSTGGYLRYVANETIAAALYGPDWNTKIDDIPDAFFTNYKMGSAINSATDYLKDDVMNLATSIDADKAAGLPTSCTTCQTPTSTTPTATTTLPTVTLTVAKSPIHVNEVQTLTATAQDPAGIKKISLFYNNQLVTACVSNTSCTGDYLMPATIDKTTYEAKAIVETNDLRQAVKVIEVPIDSSAAVSNEVSITVDQSVIKPGQSTGITVLAADTIDVKNITIYVNDGGVKGCDYSGRQCKWSQVYDGTVGTVFTVYGIVTNTGGRTYRSESKTITLATNDVPQVLITSGPTTIYSGETLQVTVNGADENGIKWSELLNSQHVVLKHCDGAAPCTLVTGPWTQKGLTTLYGKVSDLLNAVNEQPFTFMVQ